MPGLEAIAWSARLPVTTELPDFGDAAALAEQLIASAAAESPVDVRGKLAAFLGTCLVGPEFGADAVCRVALDFISPRDVVMVVFDDGRPPIAKVYLGTHEPVAPYPELPGFNGKFLVLWAANPEVVAIVPGDEVACLWPVRGLWRPTEGWQPFASYPFTPEQKARLESFQGFEIISEQLIPHYDVNIDTGVPRD